MKLRGSKLDRDLAALDKRIEDAERGLVAAKKIEADALQEQAHVRDLAADLDPAEYEKRKRAASKRIDDAATERERLADVLGALESKGAKVAAKFAAVRIEEAEKNLHDAEQDAQKAEDALVAAESARQHASANVARVREQVAHMAAPYDDQQRAVADRAQKQRRERVTWAARQGEDAIATLESITEQEEARTLLAEREAADTPERRRAEMVAHANATGQGLAIDGEFIVQPRR